jgi:hypothetical protein
MGRQAPPVAYNEKMLASLATRLERAAARLRAVRDQVDREKKLDRLYIFNHKSMSLAVESVEAFSFETEKSWDAMERGEPYASKTTKAQLSGRKVEQTVKVAKKPARKKKKATKTKRR